MPADTAAPPSPHILVVDDDRDIRDALARYLERQGYRVDRAESVAAARRVLRDAAIDLVVLDIMMPGEDGLVLCRELRAAGTVPVILLTALVEDTDRVVGLEIGADDYVTKPFNPRELVARIKAVLRRTHALPPQRDAPARDRARFDRWTLDRATRTLIDDAGLVVPLSTGEYRLLDALVRRPGVVMGRDRLLDLTRGREAAVFDRSIDNQISRLRRKIERDPKTPAIIRTHWGGGYSLAAPVAEEGGPGEAGEAGGGVGG
ncbi:MAG: response regulator [Azospirillaceae bacterium]